MPQLIVLVIHDPGKVDELLQVWVEAGVPGITLFDSFGLSHQLGDRILRDDLPLMPSVRAILRGTESASRTVFSVVDDGFDLETLVARTESVIGSLAEGETGIMFAIPVSRVVGQRHQDG